MGGKSFRLTEGRLVHLNILKRGEIFMKTIIRMKRSQSGEELTLERGHQVQDQIRRRAFELYEQRGHVAGHELEDWLQAEAEVKQTSAAA